MDKQQEKLTQDVTIKLTGNLADLPAKERVALIDSMLASNKPLIVDFAFSHTGRKINRRVYSLAGHKAVAGDLMMKPITINHDSDVNTIIGRIKGAKYIDMMDEARAYFKRRRLSESGLQQIHDSLDSLDYEKIADAFHRTKVLVDRNWKGIGRIGAKAEIVDQESIIKFLDQRYLNFSAEQDTDSYVCSHCFKDWKKDGWCEHEPGSIVDGKLVFMMCGRMVGMGSSVVMHGADPDSMVEQLTMSDAETESPIEIFSKLSDNIIFDAHCEFKGDNMELKELILADKSYNNYKEIVTLVDSTVKLLDEETFNSLPDSSFVKSIPATSKEDAAFVTKLVEQLKGQEELKAVVEDLNNKILLFDVEANVPAKVELQLDEVLTIVETMADSLVSEEKFNKLFVKKLEFDNLFNDNKTKSEQLDALNNSLNEKQTQLDTLTKESALKDSKLNVIRTQYNELLKDQISLAKSLNGNDKLVNSLLDRLNPMLKVICNDYDSANKKVEKIIDLLDTLDLELLSSKMNEGSKNVDVRPVVDPTNQVNPNKLSDYELKVKKQFNTILADEGLQSAKQYFAKVKRYCSDSFNPQSE